GEQTTEVTKNTAEQTTEMANKASRFTGETAEASYEHAIKPAVQFTQRTGEQTTEVTKNTAEQTTEWAADAGAYTAKTARKTADATTEAAKGMRQSTKQTSAKLDATLEDTTQITWKNYEVRLMDPDISDQLIKEAYAFTGPLLQHMAGELDVAPTLLARTIINSAPKQASRSQLKRLMMYIIPSLRTHFGFHAT
ncbi:MAG: hypothetical protein OEZ68_18420, partial [Gammaproteobacteria bacterium]|nr:hypothetical protein [Gammaproteobacteria bacterium]